MFFAYHTGQVTTDDSRVVLLGPEELSERVITAGLADWLIDRSG
jgi:hypothetical protein